MSKQYDFNWQIAVPRQLQDGCLFDKWDEETAEVELNCLFRVDEYGFFVYYKPENKETVVLEMSYMSDVRTGLVPKHYGVMAELQARGKGSLEDRTMTLCSGTDLVNIQYRHIIAPDPDTCKLWVEGLRSLSHNLKANNICPMTALMKHWKRLVVGTNEKGKIPVRSITRTFASGKTEKVIFECLKTLKLPNGKNDEIEPEDFTFDKFYMLYHEICPRTDILELFRKLSRGTEFLETGKIVKFLNEDQRDPRLNEILSPKYNVKRVKQLIAQYEPNEEFRKLDRLSFDGFVRFLMSDENSPIILSQLEIFQEMDQPLCHYYINSSHNTYLSGRQFGAKSSVEMYRQTLLAGCRCVELDIWDGKGEDQEPIITHGKAMCTDILFKDAVLAIRDTAFVVSDYPVILSFENHCSKPQQYKMAKYCDEIFGDLLLKQPIDGYPLQPGAPLPPPKLLLRKILIKNKRLKPEVEKHGLELMKKGQEAEVLKEDTNEDSSTLVAGEEVAVPPASESGSSLGEQPSSQSTINVVPGVTLSSGQFNPPPGPEHDNPHPEPVAVTEVTMLDKTLEEDGSSPKNEVNKPVMNGNAVKDSTSSPTSAETSTGKVLDIDELLESDKPGGGKSGALNEGDEALLANYTYTGATTTIHPYLSSLISYAQPVKFQGFVVAAERNISYNMSSFNESAGLNLLKTAAIDFVNYNKRQMSRIYPKGGRVDSSNFLPQLFWNTGCQLVSLNFQTADLGFQLNSGKFEFNGNCGYVLKPEFMRRPDRTFDPFSESSVDGVIAASCSVQVISGQFLSDKKVGTYVEVDMYGLPTDTIRKEYRTQQVPANGLNPVYPVETFEFRKIILPDLAMLRFCVYDETNKVLGQRVLPLDALQNGYRHISLRTEANFPLSLPTLFCHIELKTYVPEGLSDLVDALFAPQKIEKKVLKPVDSSGQAVEPENLDQPSKSRLTLEAKDTKKVGATVIAQADQTALLSKSDKQKDESTIEPVPVEKLKKDKAYLELLKKQTGEIDLLNRKHNKERLEMLRMQTAFSERLIIGPDKPNAQKNKISNNGNLSLDEELLNKMGQVVAEQTKDWTQLVRQNLKEKHDLLKSHCSQQCDLVKRLLDVAQVQQIKDMENKHEKENTDMKTVQAKQSVEQAKTVQHDKSIKNKAEKERRIKEINSNNTKKFMDERRRLAGKQSRQIENLKKLHVEQGEEMVKENEELLQHQDLRYEEAKLTFKDETVV